VYDDRYMCMHVYNVFVLKKYLVLRYVHVYDDRYMCIMMDACVS